MLLLAACDGASEPPVEPNAAEPTFAGSASCATCHTNEFQDWKDSHHDLAMQVATADTVLGDFNDATFEYFDKETHFLREANRFLVKTDDVPGDPRARQGRSTQRHR